MLPRLCLAPSRFPTSLFPRPTLPLTSASVSTSRSSISSSSINRSTSIGRTTRHLPSTSSLSLFPLASSLRPYPQQQSYHFSSPSILNSRRPFSSRNAVVDSYSSSGVILDPYFEHAAKEKAAKDLSLFSVRGLQNRWAGVKAKLQSGVSFGHIRKHAKTFELKGFGRLSQNIFIDFHEAYEKGDVKRLAALCTEDLYLNLKSQIKRSASTAASTSPTNRRGGREGGREGVRRVLRFLAFTGPTVIVQGRHIYNSGGGTSSTRTQTGYGQVTVVVSSRREEFDVDSQGRRREGGTGGGRGGGGGAPFIFENESILVLEVAFSDPKGRWRLASVMEEERKTDLVTNSMAKEAVAM